MRAEEEEYLMQKDWEKNPRRIPPAYRGNA